MSRVHDLIKPDDAAAAASNSSSSSSRGDQQKSLLFREFERELSNLKDILEEIGLYSFRKALSTVFNDLLMRINIKRLKNDAKLAVDLIESSFELLKSIADDCVRKGKEEEDDNDDEMSAREMLELSSEKLRCLVDLFRERRCSDNVDVAKFHAIVFAERKLTVEYLAAFFNALANDDNEQYGYLKSGFVVGSSTYSSKEAAGSLSDEEILKQRHVIQAFGLHKINILFATKVIEEGIDIPKCNMVIRYNVPSTFGSYYQSKGRARHKDSAFYFLVDKEAAKTYLTDLENFLQVENVCY